MGIDGPNSLPPGLVRLDTVRERDEARMAQRNGAVKVFKALRTAKDNQQARVSSRAAAKRRDDRHALHEELAKVRSDNRAQKTEQRDARAARELAAQRQTAPTNAQPSLVPMHAQPSVFVGSGNVSLNDAVGRTRNPDAFVPPQVARPREQSDAFVPNAPHRARAARETAAPQAAQTKQTAQTFQPGAAHAQSQLLSGQRTEHQVISGDPFNTRDESSDDSEKTSEGDADLRLRFDKAPRSRRQSTVHG